MRLFCVNEILYRLSNKCPCTGAQIYIWLPHLGTRFCVRIRISGYGLSIPAKSKLEFVAVSIPGLWGFLELSTVEVPLIVFDTRFRIGFDLATTRSSSPAFSNQPFRYGLRDPDWTEMTGWKLWDAHDIEQTEKMVPFFTGETAFRQDVDKMILISTYSILHSKLILSNNQSSATLWERETCLIGGLLSLIIIWITAPWSSKNLNEVSKRESFVFEVKESRFVNPGSSNGFKCFFVFTLERFSNCPLRHRFSRPVEWFKEECNTSLTNSQRSRAGIPSMRRPASEEKTSDSVEPCETEICFLHIQLMGTNVRLPKFQRVSSTVDLESSKISDSLELWDTDVCFWHPTDGNKRSTSEDTWTSPRSMLRESSQSAMPCCISPHASIVCNKRVNRLSHDLVQFVTARVNLFTDHKVYQCVLPNTGIVRQFDRKLLTILAPFPFLPFWIDGHAQPFYSSIRSIVPRTSHLWLHEPV